jgi:protein TonB
MVTGGLFYALADITGIGKTADIERAAQPDLHLLMVQEDSEVELRRRELPPEPTPPESQAAPTMLKVAQPVMQVETIQPKLDLPDIEFAAELNLSPVALTPVAAPKALSVQAEAIDPGFVTNPTVLRRFNPDYPRRAQRRKIEGHVVIEFTVQPDGAVQQNSIRVIESVPLGVFDRNVLRAVKRWRFETRLKDGSAVAYRARQELQFRLEN